MDTHTDDQRGAAGPEPRTGRQAGAPTELPTLSAAVGQVHRSVRELSADHPVSPSDPRLHIRMCDNAVAALSAHLAAMERVVYPVARRRLPDGREAVAGQLRLTREITVAMRLIEQRIWGDTYGSESPLAELRQHLAELSELHAAAEQELLDRLEAVLPDAEQSRIVRDLASATSRGPTRPHPHAPHSGRLTPLTFRLSAACDHVLDAMDARHVAARPVRKHPSRLGRWDWYLLGSAGSQPPDELPTGSAATPSADAAATTRKPTHTLR